MARFGWLLLLASTCPACGDNTAPISDARALACPGPEVLPFRTQTTGFQHAGNAKLAAANLQNKDEAADTLGNPNGKLANVFLDDTAAPTASAVDYRGAIAVSTPTTGLLSTALPDEPVSLWVHDTSWTALGRT